MKYFVKLFEKLVKKFCPMRREYHSKYGHIWVLAEKPHSEN